MRHIFSIIIVASLILVGGLNQGIAQEAASANKPGESNFRVLGNCNMCKDRIERAAYSVKGVRSAIWDQKAQKLKVIFRPDRTNQEEIERAVAKVGHDTENFLTHDEIHANLHACCIYKRDAELLKKNKKFDEI